MISLVERSTIKLLFFYVTKAKKKINFEDHQSNKTRESPPISFFSVSFV